MTLKQFGIIALKNAINAAILSLAPVWQDPHHWNFTTHAGLIRIGKLALTAIAIREGTVWVPKLLKWTTINGSQP